MSDPVSALMGASSDGFCSIEEAGLVGMITLRADLSLVKVAKAVKAATGCVMPGQGRVTTGTLGGKSGQVAWMSPDELLLMVDHGAAPTIEARLATALKASHALVVNVSDARAVFHVTGDAAHEVIGKLSPADLRGFKPGTFRRSRLAQVPAAFHMPNKGGFEVICFRSVAGYVFDILTKSSKAGSEVGFSV